MALAQGGALPPAQPDDSLELVPPDAVADNLELVPPDAKPDPPPTFASKLRDAANYTGTAAVNAISGVVGLPHTASELDTTLGNRIATTAGYQPDTTPSWTSRHTYSPEEIKKGIFDTLNWLSTSTGGQPIQPYQPTSTAGQVGMDVASAAIPAAMGAPETALPRIMSAVTGTLGAKTAQALDPNDPLAPVAGGAIGGPLGTIPSVAANRTLSLVPGIGKPSPTVDMYKRLDVDPVLAGDVTGNKLLQQVQATGLKLPLGGRIHDASENTLNQWGDALEKTADSLAPLRTPIQTGTAVQGSMQNWLSTFKASASAAANHLDQQMPPTTPVPLTNYGSMLSGVRSTMPTLQATAKTVTPGFTSDLLDDLMTDMQKGPADWQSVKTLRTRLGDMLSSNQIIGDPNYTDLKRIYGALSDDMGAAANAQSPAAAAAFAKSSAITRNGHDFIDNYLSRLYAPRNGILPEQSVNAAFGDDGSTLTALRKEAPGAADALAAYKLRDAALATPGQQNATGLKMSPGTFVTDMAKLTPESHDALFGADPALAARVADLRGVGDSMKKTERAFLNTSSTGAHGSMTAGLLGLTEAVPAAWEGFQHFGIPGAVAGAASGLTPFVPGLLAGRLTTTPWLTRTMARVPPAAPMSLPARAGAGAAYPYMSGLLGN